MRKKSHVFSQKKRPQTKDGFGTWYSEAKFDLPWISCYAFDRTTNKEPSVRLLHLESRYIPNRSDLANTEFILRQRHLYLRLCLRGKTQFKLRITYRESAKGFVKFSSFILGWIIKTILGSHYV